MLAHWWKQLSLLNDCVDFKGPLPSCNKNVYFLNIVDEYSRFPFVFPCPDVSSATVIKCFTDLFSIFGMPGFVHSDRGAVFMSQELRSFLTSKGVCSSRTTSFNPSGNGQAEKYNGTVWKAITMALKSRNLPLKFWQNVLPDALHSIRSLLCTATNETPHERIFNFPRKSTTGSSVPTWLAQPGPVLLKRHVRNKSDPLVDEVELLHANPHYAFVRFPNGRETSVATKHLAPSGGGENLIPESEGDINALPDDIAEVSSQRCEVTPAQEQASPEPKAESPAAPALPRRSERIRRPVDRFGYSSFGTGRMWWLLSFIPDVSQSDWATSSARPWLACRYVTHLNDPHCVLLISCFFASFGHGAFSLNKG